MTLFTANDTSSEALGPPTSSNLTNPGMETIESGTDKSEAGFFVIMGFSGFLLLILVVSTIATIVRKSQSRSMRKCEERTEEDAEVARAIDEVIEMRGMEGPMQRAAIARMEGPPRRIGGLEREVVLERSFSRCSTLPGETEQWNDVPLWAL
ncbi:uncharacterized protein PAC_05920 [Phialocephala subalpina]|uniref:Transmembrane protein n=1 Tax=Phialocephala subalpina TaxID=576137 RepID=A0A1L7WTC5_9HELO|nr:uncharacterized protein PAC_05920 [Phialocephala subalpina]